MFFIWGTSSWIDNLDDTYIRSYYYTRILPWDVFVGDISPMSVIIVQIVENINIIVIFLVQNKWRDVCIQSLEIEKLLTIINDYYLDSFKFQLISIINMNYLIFW